MRVLHLIPSFVGGGAERQLAYLANSLPNLGIETHIAYVHGGPNLSRIAAGSVLHPIPYIGNHNPLLLVQIIRLIRKIRPHVVQTWLLQMDVFGGIASRLLGVPWILSERCSAKMYGNNWKFILRHRIGKRASAIVANSEAGLEYWAPISRSPFNRVVRNVIPFDEIAAASRIEENLESLNDVDKLIVVAGRYDTQKNLFVLLEAVDKVLNVRPRVQTVFFGEGPLKNELITAKDALRSARRIHILGYTDRLYYWMKRAEVYISVSQFEGNPNTVLEAVACRCPIVVSDIPEHREILDSRCALFVHHDSVEEIANALGIVLDNSADAKAKADIAMEQFRRWSPEYVTGQYSQLYNEIIEKSPRG